jgi:predicted heme/steroid binding protein/CheY-like chemotaxis protein
VESIRILLIEDNPGDARLVKEYLADYKNALFTLEWKDTLAGGLKSLSEGQFDVILLDLGLPDSQRSASFTRTQSAAPSLPIVVLTGLDDETFAGTTVRRGAQDYLVKGKIDTDTLVRTIRYAIARKLGGDRRFTIVDLKQFDGGEGRPAYVAFKGKVYDVSNSQLWKGGKHAAVHAAGMDLTEALAKAPHGEDKLSRAAVVGELVKNYESKTSETFNLKIALGILLFIITLGTLIWRWTGYEDLYSSPASVIYLSSFIVQTAICLVLDYYGKKILYL